MTRSQLLAWIGALAILVAAAPMAFGQSSTDKNTSKPATRSNEQPKIEEIVVTATRRETDIQKTPVAVTAFSAEALKAQNVQTLQDITRIAPGVRFTGEGNAESGIVMMRGLGAAQIATSGPAVQVYENDFNISGFGFGVATYDVANIQVLKGPQGTLFGRNTLGGAILYNTEQPSFRQDGYFRVSYGNHDYWALEGAANATLAPDVLAVRMAGQFRRRDGWVTSIARDFGYAGSHLDKLADVDTDSLRTSLLFTPGDRFKNTLVLEYFHGDETGQPAILVDPSTSSAVPPAERAALSACDHLCVAYGNNNFVFFRREFYTAMDTAIFEASPELTFKNILGYSRRTTRIATDTDASSLAAQHVAINAPSTFYSEEFQVLGQVFDRFDWIVGGYYQYSDSNGPNGSVIVAPLALIASNGGHSDTKAVFLNVDTEITSKLKLHTGIRYTWDYLVSCSVGFALATTTLVPMNSDDTCEHAAAAPPGTGSGILTQSADAPTWVVGLDYQATDDLFFYVTSRRGYRSGTNNTPVFNTTCSTGGGPTTDNISSANGNSAFGPVLCLDFGHQVSGIHSGRSVDLRPLQTVDPEYLTDVEVGVRATWAYRGWLGRVNTQYFHYDYTHVAESVFLGGLTAAARPVLTPRDPGAPLTGAVAFNGGKLTADGVEGDIMVKPTRDLTLDFGFSWVQQKPVEATVPAGFLVSQLPPFSVPTPKWSASYSMNYVLPWKLVGGDLVFDYNYFYTDSFVAQETVIPGYDLHSARLEWNDVAASPISVAFFTNNIFDKRYITAAANLGNGVANYGEPRMFGLDVTYRF